MPASRLAKDGVLDKDEDVYKLVSGGKINEAQGPEQHGDEETSSEPDAQESGTVMPLIPLNSNPAPAGA